MIAYSVYNPEDTTTIQEALMNRSSNHGKSIIHNIIIKGGRNTQSQFKIQKNSQLIHRKLSISELKQDPQDLFEKSDRQETKSRYQSLNSTIYESYKPYMN